MWRLSNVQRVFVGRMETDFGHKRGGRNGIKLINGRFKLNTRKSPELEESLPREMISLLKYRMDRALANGPGTHTLTEDGLRNPTVLQSLSCTILLQ